MKIYPLLFTLMITAFSSWGQTAVLTCFGDIANINANTYAINSTFGGVHIRFSGSKNSDKIFVSRLNAPLRVLNANGSAIVDSIPVKVSEVSAMQHADTLFGINSAGTTFYRVNTLTKTIIDSANFPGLSWMEERPDNGEVWVSVAGGIRIFNTNGSLTSATMTTTGTNLDQGDFRFTGTGDTVYNIANNQKKVYKIDAENKIKLDSADVNGTPGGLELSTNGSKLFVSTGLNNKIYIYNTSDMTLADSIVLDKAVQALYRNPYASEIWSIHQFNGQINIYDDVTLVKIDSITGTPANPGHLAFTNQSVGISRLDRTKAIANIYPNPAQNTLYVRSNGDQELYARIFNAEGKIIATYSFKSDLQVDISLFSSGFYFIELGTDDRDVKQTMKFYKK